MHSGEDMEKTKTYGHTDNKRYKHNVTHTIAGESILTVKKSSKNGGSDDDMNSERGCYFEVGERLSFCGTDKDV